MNDFYYRKVDAYQLAKELTKYVYLLLRKYPTEERHALTDQTRRAAISVPANIAEGLGRFSIKERIHFLDIAYGSLTELLCEIEISHDNSYITDEEFAHVDVLASRVSMIIYGLKKSLEVKLSKQNNNPE
ncbi:MAG: four helix bundle protein [Prevotella sp.]|nr:four helix bundle protein [Prevotella sp.]